MDILLIVLGLLIGGFIATGAVGYAIKRLIDKLKKRSNEHQ